MKINPKLFEDKLVFFDLETSLIEAYTHYIGSKCSIFHNQVKKDKKIICISYMVEGWKKPKTLVWKDGDDRKLLKDFAELIEQYPVWVAQNGDNFDVKVLNGRAWAEQLPPFTNIHTLDTLKFSRHSMKLTSHKLDYKLKVLGDTGKNPMGFGDWIAVQQGDKKALSKMITYCEKDVTGLRKVFWSMLPYVDKLPFNLGVLLHGDRESCYVCGSKDIIRWGTRPSNVGMKQRWKCNACEKFWTDTRLKRTTDESK